MKYTITGDIARKAICKAVESAEIGMVVSIGQQTRSSEQNAMLHHLLTDIANQKEWIEDDSGPRCTAFIEAGQPVPFVDTNTLSLF